jgi:predicted aspartyl protease
MRGWRPGLLLLLGLSSAASAADQQNCTLKEYASLDLVAEPPAVPIIETKIGGRTLHLAVDTGGIYSMLDPRVADALGLEQHPIRNQTESYDVTGNLAKTYVEARDVEIGPIHLDKMAMIAAASVGGRAIDGTLAPDFLSRFDVDFDFAHRKMNLFSPDHCEGKVVYWSTAYATVPFRVEGTHIVVPMSLDGHDVNAVVDTGSTYSTISEGFAHDVLGLSETSPGVEHSSNSKPGDLFHYAYRFKSLSINGIEIKNPLLLDLPDLMRQGFRRAHRDDDRLRDDPVYGFDLKEPQVILGTDVLSKLHLFVSYREKNLYLTAADAH